MYDKDNCVLVLTEQMQTEEGATGEYVYLYVCVYIYI